VLSYVSVVIDDAGGNGNGILDPGETATLRVTLRNNGSAQAYGLSGVLSESDGYIEVGDDYGYYGDISSGGGLGSTSSDVYEVTADGSCPKGHVVNFTLAVSGGGQYGAVLGMDVVVGDRVVLYADDFSFDLGWSGLGGLAEWTIGPAVGGTGTDGSGGPDPAVDHSPNSNNYVLGNDLTGGTGGDYNSSLSNTYWVTSPVINCSGFTGVIMKYYHWLGVEGNSADHVYLQVYNGTSWVPVFENGTAAINENSWTESNYDLSSYADNRADFQIRFGLGRTDGSVNYCGWNIDDIELKGYGDMSPEAPQLVFGSTEMGDSLNPGDISHDTLRIYNNGTDVLRLRFSSVQSWLGFATSQQNINPLDSLDFVVTYNSVGLVPGTHVGTLDFVSNDSHNGGGSIPVTMHVYAPDISLSLTAITGSVPVGGESSYPLVIENHGPGRLDFGITRQMFDGKGKMTTAAGRPPVVGYRAADGEKGGAGSEPYYGSYGKGSGGPDVWGYSWVDSDDPNGPAFSWVDISGVGTSVTLADDDTTAAVNIGFGFPFYENIYTQVNISSNGLVTFSGGSTLRTNTSIPNDSLPNNMLSLWWDDLDPRKGGHIYYYYDVVGTRFIVSYDDIRNYYSTTGTGSLSFQVILYPDGKILLQYGVMNPGSDAQGLSGATVGIENADGTDGLQVVFNGAYMHDNLAISMTAASWLWVDPGSGSIPGFGSDTVMVRVTPGDLAEGVYNGQLKVLSNDPETPQVILPVEMTVIPPYICGNANGDGVVNIMDITYLVNFLYKSGPVPNPMEAGDANGDGSVNIRDITYLVNFLYKSGPIPLCP
jgi:Dockerin type I domain